MLTALPGPEWDAYPLDIAHALDAAARFVLIAGAVAVLLTLLGLAVISRAVWAWRNHRARPARAAADRSRAFRKREHARIWRP